MSKILKRMVLLFFSLAPVSVTNAQNSTAQQAQPAASSIATLPAKPRKLACGPLGPSDDKEAISGIGSLYERPATVEQLLKNLKIAFDNDLFLQPGFYDDGNLSKFFAATKVTWGEPKRLVAWDPTTSARRIWISADNGVIEHMTVYLGRSCNRDLKYEPQSKADVVDHAAESGGGTLEMNEILLPLDTVRAVFGEGWGYKEDKGLSDHGPSYEPTTKGSVIYTQDQSRKPPDSRLARDTVTFELRLTCGKAQTLCLEDLVERITFNQWER